MCALNAHAQLNWTKLQDFPAGAGGRRLSTSFTINNQVFYVAGLGASGPKSENWAYNTSTNLWEQKSNPQFLPRFNSVAFVINDKGYFGAGNLASGSTYTPIAANDFYEYNPISDLWTIRNAIGATGRYGAVGFSINGKGYVGLGANSTIFKEPYNYIGSPVFDILMYDPSSGLWNTAIPNTGYYAAINAQVFVIKNKAYICGGFVPASFVDPKYFNDGLTIRATMEFNPLSNSITSKSNMPVDGRHYAVSFSSLDRGYIGGGNVSPSSEGVSLNTIDKYTMTEIFKYNPNTDVWTTESSTSPLGIYTQGASSSNCGYGYISHGLVYTNSKADYSYSTYRVEAVPDNSYITGSSTVCTSADSQFNLNLSDAGSVTWTTSPNIYITSGQGTKTVNVRGSSNGNGWVQASINLACRVVRFPQKTVWVGAPKITQVSITCLEGTSMTKYEGMTGGSMNWSISPANYIYLTTANSASVWGDVIGTNYTLTLSNPNGCPGESSSSVNGTIRACSTGGGGGNLRVFPNPANTVLNVEITPETTSASLLSSSNWVADENTSSSEFSIRLSNSYGTPVANARSNKGRLSLDISNLSDGLYFLKMDDGAQIITKQIMIKH